jgi:acyl-CoA synthetase (AMP-forming)/AMP-acid ligase II
MGRDEAIKSVADITRYHAATKPDKVAVVFYDRQTTYARLDERASRVANGLIAEGCKPQTRIAHLDKNSDEFYELLFGAAKANAVMVSVNWRLAPPEIAYVINDAGAEVLFVGPEFVGLVEKIRDQLTTVRTVIALGAPHDDWPHFSSWRDAQSAEDPMLETGPDDVAIQMYTSGTTGHPKGVQLTNHNFIGLLPQAIAQWENWTEDDVSIVCMPLFHIAGSGWGLVAFYVGAQNVILREVDPGEILETIPRYGVTMALFVPAVVLFLCEHPKAQETDWSSLKLVIYGAAPMPVPLLQRAMKIMNCGFAQVYGLTETCGAVTYLPPEDHDPEGNERMKSCGKAQDNVGIRVVDAEGNDVPLGEVGEIIVKSPQVMKGYWNLPDATAGAIRDGWFHTGDAGYLDADGYIYIHDRVKDMIVSGGENIYPAEIESALMGHPQIADVAVIGVPDEKWGESVMAIIVAKDGEEIPQDELEAFARERIAGYKVPRHIAYVDELPRNPSGKILKRELRKPYWEGQERQVG